MPRLPLAALNRTAMVTVNGKAFAVELKDGKAR